MFLTIATHHPSPDHIDDFIDHMQRVIAATEGAEGLIEFGSWRDPETDRLFGIAKWESEDAFRAALPRIGSLRQRRRPEWTIAEDELLTLTTS
jgi:quinol monooxygenase YgiN